jgi:hypothetical protein
MSPLINPVADTVFLILEKEFKPGRDFVPWSEASFLLGYAT